MRRWGFRRAYPTVEAMLDAEELDALFVLTPRSEHVHRDGFLTSNISS